MEESSIRAVGIRQALAKLAVAVLSLALLTAPGAVLAQADPADHSAHHPGGGASAPPPAPAAGSSESASMPSAPAPAMTSGTPAAAGCGGMMGCMGGGPRPFYPALMAFPSLTPEARQFIEAEAGRRLGAGSEAIATGQALLHQALSSNNPTAMQQAIAGVRQGVLQAASGAAALRAVNEGEPPRQIALTWFKGLMGLPTGESSAMVAEFWNLSWYHVMTMIFLVAFLAWSVVVHFARSRRIAALVEELKTGAPGSAPGSVPKQPAATVKPPDGSGAVAPPNPAPARSPRPWKGVLRVAAVFVETEAVKTFRLMDPERAPIPFSFMPGQYLTFSAEISGRRVSCAYTIASSPTQRDYVELTVKREELGSKSRRLHDHVAPGDLVEVAGPSGAFTFTGTESDSIVLIAGGVGITPMMSIIRYLTDRSYPGDIFLLYGIGSAGRFIFRQEVDYLEKRHPNLHVVVTVEEADGTPWTGATGRITKDFIAQSVPRIVRRRVHVCGPPPMMDAVKAALDELDVPAAQVKFESFAQAKGMAPVAEVISQSEAASAGADPAVTPAASPDPAPQVAFSRSGKTGSLARGQSVLEAAEAIGVFIDFECRVGTCGRCKVLLTQGVVTMAIEEGLPPEEKARGIVLACQAQSDGNLVVVA